MDYGRLSWRGIIDVEADRVALRDDEGAPHDIRDLFVSVDDIGTVREVLTNIGGGFTHTTLTWNDEDDQPPTDAQVPGLASLLRFLDEDRPAKTYNIFATRNYRPIVDEFTFHTTKRVAVHNRHFEVNAPEPALLLKTRQIYTPTTLRPWVAPEAPFPHWRRGAVGPQGLRGRTALSVATEAFFTRGRAQNITLAPKLFATTAEAPLIIAKRAAPRNVVERTTGGNALHTESVLMLRTKTTHTEKSHTHEIFVSEPMPGARGLRGPIGSRGPPGWAIAEPAVPIYMRPHTQLVQMQPGQPGQTQKHILVLTEAMPLVVRPHSSQAVAETSRTERVYIVQPDSQTVSRRGPAGVAGVPGKRAEVPVETLLIERLVRREFTERVQRVGFHTEVFSHERRTNRVVDRISVRQNTLLECPAVTLGRKGIPGARGAPGRPTTVLETAVERIVRREVVVNTPKAFWIAPEATALQVTRNVRPVDRTQRFFSSVELPTFVTQRKYSIQDQSSEGQSGQAGRRGPRGAPGVAEPPLVILPKKGEQGPRGARGTPAHGDNQLVLHRTVIRTNTITQQKHTSSFSFAEPWISQASAKPGPPGKAGRPAFAQELTGHIMRKAIAVTNVSRRAWNFAGDFFSSVTKRVYQVSAEYVSYAKPQVLTEEQALRALDNVRSLDYLLRIDRAVALSTDKKNTGQANLGLPAAYVAYDRPQTNTEEERLQARRNLGLPDSLKGEKGDPGEKGDTGEKGETGERGADGANSSNIGELIGTALGAATAGGAIGQGLAGLLGRIFGGGGGLPGNVQDAIDNAQQQITRGSVRYDKTQSLSSAEKARARANIGVSADSGGGDGGEPNLDGVLRFNEDQSEDVLPEEAAMVRNTLRLPQTYLRLDVTQESNQVGLISAEAAALIRQALGIPDEMRHYHVRQIVVQRDDHYLNMKVYRTSRHTHVTNNQEFRFERRRASATE